MSNELTTISILGPLKDLYDLSRKTSGISGFLVSFYFAFGMSCLALMKRLPYLIRLNPQPNSLFQKCIVRIPLIIAASYLLYAFQFQEPQELYFVFFLFYCFDNVMLIIHQILESPRRYREGEEVPPNILEWGACLHFGPLSKYPVMPSVTTLACIELLQIIAVNIFGIFGIFSDYRLIPSTILEFARIFHFLYCMLYLDQPYPTLFYLERIPELLILSSVAILSLIYLFANIISSSPLRTPLIFQVDIDCSNDFHTLLRKWGEALTTGPKNSLFANELSPILSPIGIGLPPTLLINLDQKPQPFQIQQKSKPRENSWLSILDITNGDSIGGLKFAIRLWYLLGVFPLVWIGSPLIKYCQSKFRACIPDFDESDFEYIPGEESDGYSEAGESDSEIEDCDSDSVKSEMEGGYKELFDLALDLHQNSIPPTSFEVFNSLIESSTTPRKLRRSGKVISPLPKPSQAASQRVCVVCQFDERNIVMRPCGCLCLCEGCREILAARQTSNCPCCRQVVEGTF